MTSRDEKTLRELGALRRLALHAFFVLENNDFYPALAADRARHDLERIEDGLADLIDSLSDLEVKDVDDWSEMVDRVARKAWNDPRHEPDN